MITLKAKVREYRTEQGDIWDLIALACYGDEHAMHFMQDANYEYREVGFFLADVLLIVPPVVQLNNDLKHPVKIPNLKELLPWR
jgi:phage tail protein X